MFKHVLVPTDGSELSRSAVEKAIGFAKDAGAKLTFLNVMPEAPPPSTENSDAARYDPGKPKRFLQEAEQRAREFVDPALAAAKAAGVVAEAAFVPSHSPHEAIIRTAQDRNCDLIFMASRGRSGINALLLGSETHKVLNLCKIPVLVYR